MVFSSNIFLLFFLPIFLAAYFATPARFRNYTLLFFSLLFYAFGAPDFILLLVASCVINYFIVRWMVSMTSSGKKKLLCAFSVVLSLGLLLYFKYANFFIENINGLLGLFHFHSIQWTKVLLPIGISFFTLSIHHIYD